MQKESVSPFNPWDIPFHPIFHDDIKIYPTWISNINGREHFKSKELNFDTLFLVRAI